MTTVFVLLKKNTLAKKDKSSKGSIDAGIAEIVSLLNGLSDYCTTSSCSGRIMLVEKDQPKKEHAVLFASHECLSLIQLHEVLGMIHSPHDVWFRQESFILHVTCADLTAAQRLLQACNLAGLKRAGITALGERIQMEILGTEYMETLFYKRGECLVEDRYLKLLLEEANQKMKKNKERLSRFLSSAKQLAD